MKLQYRCLILQNGGGFSYREITSTAKTEELKLKYFTEIWYKKK